MIYKCIDEEASIAAILQHSIQKYTPLDAMEWTMGLLLYFDETQNVM